VGYEEITMFEYKRVGGIRFFRIGQFGFSCYITRKHPPVLSDAVCWGVAAVCYAVSCVQLVDIFNNW
jgi:hypothetical protein